jgi:hypothetical protein
MQLCTDHCHAIPSDCSPIRSACDRAVCKHPRWAALSNRREYGLDDMASAPGRSRVQRAIMGTWMGNALGLCFHPYHYGKARHSDLADAPCPATCCARSPQSKCLLNRFSNHDDFTALIFRLSLEAKSPAVLNFLDQCKRSRNRVPGDDRTNVLRRC